MEAKVITVFAAMMLLVSVSLIPNFADVQPNLSKRDLCKKQCTLDCWPESSPLLPCMSACMKACDRNSSALINTNSDVKTVRGCGDSSANDDCEAS